MAAAAVGDHGGHDVQSLQGSRLAIPLAANKEMGCCLKGTRT